MGVVSARGVGCNELITQEKIRHFELAGLIVQRMSNSPPSPEKIVDLQIARLNIIQGIITRMSSFSASAKNFCVTISVGVIAAAYQKQIEIFMSWGAAFAFVSIFSLMDGYYLALERNYRNLYNEACKGPFGQNLDMNLVAQPLKVRDHICALKSASVARFYVPLLITVMTLLLIAHYVQPDPAQARPDGSCSPSLANGVQAKQSANVAVGQGATGSSEVVASATTTQRPKPAGIATPNAAVSDKSVRHVEPKRAQARPDSSCSPYRANAVETKQSANVAAGQGSTGSPEVITSASASDWRAEPAGIATSPAPVIGKLIQPH